MKIAIILLVTLAVVATVKSAPVAEENALSDQEVEDQVANLYCGDDEKGSVGGGASGEQTASSVRNGGKGKREKGGLIKSARERKAGKEGKGARGARGGKGGKGGKRGKKEENSDSNEESTN